MKLFNARRIKWFLFVLIFVLGVPGLIKDLRPVPTESLIDELDDGYGTVVELITPRYLLRGKNARVELRVSGRRDDPPTVYLARLEPSDLAAPQGEIIEVSGMDGDAVFYWNLNNTTEKVFGRVWLYTLNGDANEQQAVLLFALPMEVETKSLAWGWYLLAHLTLVIGGLAGGYRARA